MINWLHRLLNPHCQECMIAAECKSCDLLRQLLESERLVNKRLLDAIIEPRVVNEEVKSQPVSNFQPINAHVSWRVRQQMLEDADRETAKKLRAKEQEMKESLKTTEQLESELLNGNEAGNNGEGQESVQQKVS